MPELLLTEVDEFAGANDKGPWLKYTLKDEHGQPVAATFATELGSVAKSLIGERVEITTKPASNPKYAPTLLSIVASANGGFTPPAPAHKPVIGGDKDRAIARMACLKAAAEIVSHCKPYIEGTRGEWSDPALEVMKSAQRFETWVFRDIDDEPFE